MKAFDILVFIALLISAYGGFKNGFIQTVFKTIGYITGGVLGIVLSVQLLSNYSNVKLKLISTIILMFLLATLGQFILAKISLVFRKVLFILPFKFVDSILGATLSSARTVLIIYLLSVILIATHFNISDKYISDSIFYSYTNSYLSKIISSLKLKVV